MKIQILADTIWVILKQTLYLTLRHLQVMQLTISYQIFFELTELTSFIFKSFKYEEIRRLSPCHY